VSGRCLAAALSAILALTVGCGGGEDDDRGRPARPSSSASLEILQPAAGAQVQGPSIDVRVELAGGEIVPQASRDLQPDKGHVHLRLNGELVSHTFGTTQTLTEVAAGDYILEAEFVAADHGPFNPRVITSTSFTVT